MITHYIKIMNTDLDYKKVQEELFALGYSWNGDERQSVIEVRDGMDLILLYHDKVLQYSSDGRYSLSRSPNWKEITIEQVKTLDKDLRVQEIKGITL